MMMMSGSTNSTANTDEQYSAQTLSQPYAFSHAGSSSDRHGSSRTTTRSTISMSHVPSSSRPKQQDPRGDEDVIIEEKRRRVHGDGYTVHQYLRGRLLGKGGFAKVYFCTALDTGKNYAVKVVSKANLVKARARQKVCLE